MQPENELPPAPPPSEWVPPSPEQAAPAPPPPPTGKDIVLAIVGGLIGAIVGGVAWGYLVKSTEMELGIAAIGVGVLAGFGVALFARGTGGMPLQVIAAAAAAFGILWGKYLAFVLVGEGFTDLFSGFDVVWIVFAVYTAFRITARKGLGRMAPGTRRT